MAARLLAVIARPFNSLLDELVHSTVDGSLLVSIDGHVDDEGPVGGQRAPQRFIEIALGSDGNAIGTKAAGEGNEIDGWHLRLDRLHSESPHTLLDHRVLRVV